MEVRQLAKEEARLLDYLKALDYGRVVIQVKNGKPFMIKHAMKEIKLTE
jgi:hypothetical protein